MSPRRDRETIERFLATYVDFDQNRTWIVDLLPVGYDGPVEDLPLDRWESVPFKDVEDLLSLGLSQPIRAFTVNLHPRAPWCGVILSCARTGEVAFGVSVDDPLNSAEPQKIARELLQTLCEETGGTRGWAVHEMPPSVDPQTVRPWDLTVNVADFVR